MSADNWSLLLKPLDARLSENKQIVVGVLEAGDRKYDDKILIQVRLLKFCLCHTHFSYQEWPVQF